MKILFDHQCFTQQTFGGVSRYHYQLVKELNLLEDVQAKLSLSYSNNHYIQQDRTFNVKKFIPKKKFPFKRTLLDRINRYSTIKNLTNGDYDIFHPTYYNPYFLNYLDNKPYVVTVYDLIQEQFPEIINSIDRTLQHKKEVIIRANKIIAISECTKKDLIKHYGISAERIEVIYLAASVNKGIELPKENLSLPEKYILFVGNRDFYKNFYNFFLAIEKILKNNQDIYLIAAGGGALTGEEYNLFESKGVKNKVIFKAADDNSLAALYANALAFIFPTLYEGFGIPVLEAMNCDCPVIMSYTSSLPEVGGDAAIYFDPNNIDDMREKIESVIFNKDLQKDLILKGRMQSQKFSFQKTALQTLEVYKQLQSKLF